MSEATGTQVTRIYGNFRGVDFRGEEINLVRSPDSLNVWKDYKETESVRTRPGMELKVGFTDPIFGIYFFDGVMLVHSGDTLYRVVDGAKTAINPTSSEKLERTKSMGFVYENVFYLKDGKTYWQYDGTALKEVVGYVPTTSIGRKPNGAGGTIYEDVNMLSPWRINTFLADGVSRYFYLDTTKIDLDKSVKVKVNGSEQDARVLGWSIDKENGVLQFTNAPPYPSTDGQDNVSVEFSKTVDGYRDNIDKCTLLQVFDNRVFFSGNPDYPNIVWHCSLDDPSYCGDLDYYKEGRDNAAVKGLVAGNNALWVFREPSVANTSVFYHTPTIDGDYGKIYPSVHSSISTGCVGKAINFNDDIVFFSERGMEGISGDVTTEQAVAHRSTLVDCKMVADPNYKDMTLEEWEGYLLVFIGNKVFLADSRTAFTNENHIEYEWFYWELEKAVICTTVNDGVLYLGTEDGIYTLTDTKANMESYWVTPKDKFKYPHYQKTTSKKSCTIEAKGEEISVYAKTNKDEDFTLLDTFTDVEDAISCRIKKKKFKDIQLKFYSAKRFSLESATLECFIGGYLKNL